jgi:DNA-binding NtrC family response regulator
MKTPADVLIAWDDEALRSRLGRLLQARGYEVVEIRTAAGLLAELDTRGPRILILGSLRGGADPLQLAGDVRRQNPRTGVILLMSESSEERAVAAIRLGALDYFKAPFSLDVVAGSAARACEEPNGAGRDRPAGRGERSEPTLLGTSASIREISAYIARVAASDSTVLITGETGTGKELAASLIHHRSPRHQRPFVCLNCAAIPDTLLESELFGFERGSFTGAHASRAGRLQQAEGGTIFFDEIGDMNPAAQPKILRAIETKEVHRVGGRASIPVDVRVVAATNQELEGKVRDGQFREDLFYRLNVARIHLPPLRERQDDLPVLVNHYVHMFNQRFGRRVRGFTPEASAYLCRYSWPGNVRELRNVVEVIYINHPPELIAIADLPATFRRRVEETEGLPAEERTRVLSVLSATNWNKSQAAQRLHWSRMTLYRKMAKYRIGKRGWAGTATTVCSPVHP